MSDQGPETSAGAITGSQTRKGQYQKKKRGFENAKNFLLFASPDSEKDEIENLPGEELLARQKELAKHIQLDMKDGRPSIFTFDIDKFAKPRLTRDSGRSYKGETINLTPDLATTERYHTLRHGLNYGYRKNDQGGRKLVLAARFTPYSAMSPEEIETIRHLSRHFHRQGELCYENNLNAAHKEAGRRA
ncbi:hypothetical protein FRC12_003988 [Ceratobasidium sp. 428]|nr:hypothetical protein FRC12_003988 [Ceratobasidium sp. 428]